MGGACKRQKLVREYLGGAFHRQDDVPGDRRHGGIIDPDRPRLRLMRRHRCDLQLDQLARQITTLRRRADGYAPSPHQALVPDRFANLHLHVRGHAGEGGPDAFAQPPKVIDAETRAAGEVEVLAVTGGPVAQTQARASLEHDRAEEAAVLHGGKYPVMQQFLLHHGKQGTHAFRTRDARRDRLVVERHVTPIHRRSPIHPCPRDPGYGLWPSGPDTPNVSTRAASSHRHAARGWGVSSTSRARSA